jgi:hypothetical protein
VNDGGYLAARPDIGIRPVLAGYFRYIESIRYDGQIGDQHKASAHMSSSTFILKKSASLKVIL